MSLARRRTALALWCAAALTLLIMGLIGGIQFPPELLNLLAAVALLLLALPTSIGVALAIVYRDAWSRWPVWAGMLLLFVVTAVGRQQPLYVGPIGLQATMTLLLVGVGAALYTACAILLFRHDVALAATVVFSLGAVWMFVIWWRLGGDFIGAIMAAMRSPASDPGLLLLPAVFISALLCLSPLVVASFLWHTWRLLLRERDRSPLPKPKDVL